MAGGSPREVFNAGAYNATKYAKIGDLGSRVLPVRPSGTVWERGSVATTRWQQTAAHGGGYIFRLCPRSEPLTEACFRRLPLEFAEPYRHVARFKNSSLDRVIKATPVTDGPAKGWMRLPLPNPTDIACDYVVPAVTAVQRSKRDLARLDLEFLSPDDAPVHYYHFTLALRTCPNLCMLRAASACGLDAPSTGDALPVGAQQFHRVPGLPRALVCRRHGVSYQMLGSVPGPAGLWWLRPDSLS